MNESIFDFANQAPEIPQPLDSAAYQDPGKEKSNNFVTFLGEAYVSGRDKHGFYKIMCSAGGPFLGRPIFNIGENILKTGIAVAVAIVNNEALILGKLRPVTDKLKSDGVATLDKSAIVGSPGDATIRPHVSQDKDATAEVTVTGGNQVKLKSTGSTNITMHPSSELIRVACQEYLAYSDGYRIQSGKTSTSSSTSAKLDTVTTESYKDKVGPSRTEIIVKNGKVSLTAVHQMSVNSLVTTGGATAGTVNFQWEIGSSGDWQIKNAKTIKFGDKASEAMVLGDTLNSFLTSEISQVKSDLQTIITSHNNALGIITPALTAVMSIITALTSILNAVPFMGLFTAVNATVATETAKLTAAIPQVAVAKAAIPISVAQHSKLQSQYLTGAGPVKAKILSDFCSLQKTAPIPGTYS